MRRFRIKKQRISRMHVKRLVAVPIDYISLKHEKKLHPSMLKGGKHVRFVSQCDQIWFDHHRAVRCVAEKLILMPRSRSATFDRKPLTCLDKSGVSNFLIRFE